RIVNQRHGAPEAAERVAEELEAIDYLLIVDDCGELRAREVRARERLLHANEERFDPAHRERALAQVVRQEQDQVLELVARADHRAGLGLPGQDPVARPPPGAGALALAVVGCSSHGSTFHHARGSGKFFTWGLSRASRNVNLTLAAS